MKQFPIIPLPQRHCLLVLKVRFVLSAKTQQALTPATKGYTVMDHIKVAYFHLTKKVGLGPHQLIRIGDGDWDDGLMLVQSNSI